MRRSLALLTLNILHLAFYLPAIRGESKGTTSLEFLTMTVGPRQNAMGGAGVAAGDDLWGTQLNPAAVGQIWRREVSLLHTEWLEDVNYQYLGYAHPTVNKGVFGVSLYSLDYGEVPGYTVGGAKTKNLDAWSRLAQVSYGKSFRDRYWAGTTVKLVQEKLNSFTGRVVLGDVGAMYQPSWRGWWAPCRFGISVKNLGGRPQFQNEKEDIPATVQAGVALRPFFQKLTAALDVKKVQGADPAALIGMEYVARDVVAFRIGYDPSVDIGKRVNFGMGFSVWGMSLDYSYVDMLPLGSTHHVGLTLRFGSTAETHYERGMKAMRQENYAAAIVEFGRVLAFDRRHKRALLRIREANDKLQKEMEKLKR